MADSIYTTYEMGGIRHPVCALPVKQQTAASGVKKRKINRRPGFKLPGIRKKLPVAGSTGSIKGEEK